MSDKSENKENENIMTVKVGETTYVSEAFFTGKTTLRDIIKRRILKECEEGHAKISKG